MSIAWGGLFIVLRVFGDTSMMMNRTSPTLLLYYNAKLGDYEWHKRISMSETKNKSTGLPMGYAPSDSEVQKYLDVWDQLDDYVCQEVALTSLFSKYPNNTDINEVLIKCTVLNQFYSAGVKGIDLLPLAEHIVSLNIDQNLQDGDWGVVEKISNCKLRNYYSFASKYCNWHNPQKYPIYDSYVDNVLYALRKDIENIIIIQRKDLKIYEIYGNALTAIANKYNLKAVRINNTNDVNFKILDKYLWLLGKLYFSKTTTTTVNDIIKALKGQVCRITVGDYIIVRAANGSIKVTVNGSVATNTKEALRRIAKIIGFSFEESWNTRQFGKNLIEYIKTNNITLIEQ